MKQNVIKDVYLIAGADRISISLQTPVRMTIEAVIEEGNIKILTVQILEVINPAVMIVGDTSGVVLLKLANHDDPKVLRCVEEGKGLKLLKPYLVDPDVISHDEKFSPQPTRAVQVNIATDDERLEELREKADDIKPTKGTSFKDMKGMAKNSSVNALFTFCTSISRIIEGKYGEYK